MSNFKRELMMQVQAAVKDLYSGIIVNSEVTENGFFCDFDMAETLDPGKIEELKRWLSERETACAYELSGFSGAYEDGDPTKKVLQRLYVTAFETADELKAYQDRLALAAERDHKKIGSQLGLFSTS